MIKTTAPWCAAAFASSCFDGWRALLSAFEAHADWPELSELEARWVRVRGVTTPGGVPLALVVDRKSRRRRQNEELSLLYDVRVMKGELPTRARSWHDFFNVGAVCMFSRTKMVIHAKNAKAILAERAGEASPLERRRSRLRDTRALLDEGGLLLAVEGASASQARQALAEGNVELLLGLERAGRLVPWVLGHALLEHAARTATGERLGAPPRGLTWVVGVSNPRSATEVDETFAHELESEDVLSEPPPWLGHTLAQWFSDVPGASAREAGPARGDDAAQ